MIQLRFYISLGTFIAIVAIMPFATNVPFSLYAVRVGILFLGFLLPAGFTQRMDLGKSVAVWAIAGLASLVGYDFAKTMVVENHRFFMDWSRFYPMGMVFLMGIQAYSRFVALFVFKQMTRPSLR